MQTRKTRNFYMNNPRLKAANVPIPITQYQVQELNRCANDINYFLETYVKAVDLDVGVVPFVPRDYQREFINKIENNRFVLGMMARQMGKSLSIIGYTLHYIIFNENKKVAILGDKEKTAKKLLRDLKASYELLPFWMQQGVVEWNKLTIELENGCRVLTGATEGASIRGESINLLMLDEFAHLGSNAAEEFMASVMPTISSGTTTKIIIITTPKGLNHFYKLWTDAENGKNDYVTCFANWRKHPRRDQAWADAERKRIGDRLFEQEYECSFIGSSGSLISPAVLAAIPFKDPIRETEGVRIFEEAVRGRSYFIGVDTSYGKGFDYSSFTVIDITEIPYRVVAVFNSNKVDPILYPTYVHQFAVRYNNASVLVEVNDVGLGTANALYHEFQYENLLFTYQSGRSGSVMGFGGGRLSKPGLKMTEASKKLGCATLKSLIEEQKLVIPCHMTILQLFRFTQQGKTFRAEEGYYDDIVMSLVIFAWATTQTYFIDLTNINYRATLFKQQLQALEDEVVPVGFWNTSECFGVERQAGFVDSDGTRWKPMD